MTAPGNVSEVKLNELHLEVFLDVQKELEDKGVIPRRERSILTRLRGFFVYLGAINLAFFLACLTILLNFIVVRMLLHIDFSRYLG